MSIRMNRIVTVSTTPKLGFSGQNRNFKAQTISRSATPSGKNNFYNVLGLHDSKNVGLAEIEKAYRKMVHHTKEEFIERFLELHKAYETLSDPDSRRRHDHEMCLEERKSNFPREVWEKQIEVLRERSELRMQMKKYRSVVPREVWEKQLEGLRTPRAI